MSGWVTEKDFEEAEEAFPGIRDLWDGLPLDARPRTFLELVFLYSQGDGQ